MKKHYAEHGAARPGPFAARHGAPHVSESWLTRRSPDLEGAWQAWRPHVPQQPVFQDLYTEAQKRLCTAAGCDGWHG